MIDLVVCPLEFSSCFTYPTLGAEGDRCTRKQKQKSPLKSQRTWKKQDKLARQKKKNTFKSSHHRNASMNTHERNEKGRKKSLKWQQLSYHKLWRPEKMAQYFWSVERKKYWPRKWSKTKRLYQQHIYLIIMAKGSSLNRNGKNKRKHIGISWWKKE